MKYIYSQIQANSGAIVEITLDKQANVRMLDAANYQRFKGGQQYQYYGGRVLRSPLRIPVPLSGTWYVVIDLGDHGGTIRHNIRLLK